MHVSTVPQAAFFTIQNHCGFSGHGYTNNNKGGSSNIHGTGYFGGRGRGRMTPHCQLCHKDGHYASACPDLASFANQSPLFI